MLKYLCALLIPLAFAACSNGGGGSSATTYKYTMAGSYNFPNITVSAMKIGTLAVSGTFTLKWNEAAQVITGTYTDSNGLTGAVTGKIQGSTREILVTFQNLVAGNVRALLFVADEASISNGNLSNATVTAVNDSGGTVDTGTFNASIEFPDDGEHGGGPALTCSGNPSGDMAAWGFMKGCRYYKVVQHNSNYNCPYAINMPINIGISGNGGAQILVNDSLIFNGNILASESSSTTGTFFDPEPLASSKKRLTLSFSSGTATSGSMQTIVNGNITVQCMIEFVEDL